MGKDFGNASAALFRLLTSHNSGYVKKFDIFHILPSFRNGISRVIPTCNIMLSWAVLGKYYFLWAAVPAHCAGAAACLERRFLRYPQFNGRAGLENKSAGGADFQARHK